MTRWPVLTRFLSILLAVLLIAVALAPAPPAEAQLVVADVLHTAQTIIHYIGRLIEIAQKYIVIANQYADLYYQYTQILNQYQQIAYQLQSLKKLDAYWARNIVGTMERMERLLRDPRLPSHVNDQVEQIHRELFPGWELPQDFWREEEEAATATIETLRGTLEAQHKAFVTSRDHIRRR